MKSAGYFFTIYVVISVVTHKSFAQHTLAKDPPAVTRTVGSLDTFINNHYTANPFSGVILIGHLYPSTSTKTPLFLKTYGLADCENNIAVSANTKFITASIAKTFTATAVLQLAEAGKINLSAPLSHYLPDSVYPHSISDSITLLQLLTHTAGLGDVITGRAFRSKPGAFYHLSQLVRLVREEQPAGKPGDFLYSDSDYILLGAVIEQVTGEDFAGYMQTQVFNRAGMRETSYNIATRPANLAHGYTTRNIGNTQYARPVLNAAGDTVLLLRPNDAILPHTGVPGAVAFTTAGDLLKFARSLAGGKLLKQDALQYLWTARVNTGRNNPNSQYTCGFFIGENGKDILLNHGGTGPGIDNCFDIYKGLGYAVIILCNQDAPAAQDIRQFIRDGFAANDEMLKPGK
jgi:CubicO group peptidase (beta-lactamase class C family)